MPLLQGRSYRPVVTCVLVLFCFSVAALARAGKNDPVFGQIHSIVQALSQITGLEEKHTVSYSRISRKQLRHFLNKRIKKTMKPEELEADELSLKMLGLVPQDFDLRRSTLDLLTEQAAAFYDYDAKKLFLLAGSSIAEEKTTVAHELAHALADQHFNLGKYMQDQNATDDADLAHTAVAEGEATWLMLAYGLKEAGQKPVPTADMLNQMAQADGSSASDYPVLKNAPLYIQRSLLFPYAEGTVFFDAVYQKLGQAAFSSVFKNPPADTSQIIHAQRYFSHQKTHQPAWPALKIPEAELLTDGSVGEFDHEVLLQQYLSRTEGKSLAAHLTGGGFRVFEVGDEETPLLQYISGWDSPGEARRFFNDYRQVQRGKWRQCTVTFTGSDYYAGVSDSGYFVTRLLGSVVLSTEGLRDQNEWNLLRNTVN